VVICFGEERGLREKGNNGDCSEYLAGCVSGVSEWTSKREVGVRIRSPKNGGEEIYLKPPDRSLNTALKGGTAERGSNGSAINFWNKLDAKALTTKSITIEISFRE